MGKSVSRRMDRTFSGIPLHIPDIHDPEYLEIIRIYHECEGRKEKSVPRNTVLHHETYRVMINGDPDGRIFLFYPHRNNGFFFLLPTVFFLKISSQKSLNIHLDTISHDDVTLT